MKKSTKSNTQSVQGYERRQNIGAEIFSLELRREDICAFLGVDPELGKNNLQQELETFVSRTILSRFRAMENDYV